MNVESIAVSIATVIAAAIAGGVTVWVGRRADRTNQEAAAISAAAEIDATQLTGWVELMRALEVRVAAQNTTISQQGRRITAVEEEATEVRRGLGAAVRFINMLIATWPSKSVPIPSIPHELVHHGVDVPDEHKENRP